MADERQFIGADDVRVGMEVRVHDGDEVVGDFVVTDINREDDEDAADLAAARAALAEPGERHSLDEVARDLGIDNNDG